MRSHWKQCIKAQYLYTCIPSSLLILLSRTEVWRYVPLWIKENVKRCSSEHENRKEKILWPLTPLSPFTQQLASVVLQAVCIPTKSKSPMRCPPKDRFPKAWSCTRYKNNYRNTTNFEEANTLPKDCDNNHSDKPRDWGWQNSLRMCQMQSIIAVTIEQHFLELDTFCPYPLTKSSGSASLTTFRSTQTSG